MLPEPLRIVARIARICEELNVRYLVGGSLASSRYGFPRATQDVDLVVDLRMEQLSPLVAALESEFYVDLSAAQEAVRRRSSFNVIHLPTMYKADLFVIESTPWAREEMNRRRQEQVGSDEDAVPLYLCSPEDSVLHKLAWFRAGGEVSERQWQDVLGVLKVQADVLDLSYLRRWAADLDLVDLLERAFDDAGYRP